MTDARCPACRAPWSRAVPIKRFPMYGKCGCSLVGRIGEVTETYDDDYFDTEDPNQGHRDFTSAWALEYDRRRFGAELDHVGPPSGSARLLDIGAATGGFLLAARRRGWVVTGVEPPAGARRIAAEDAIELVADLDDLAAERQFELVTMHHVMEHVPDPVAMLRTLRARLAPGGRILIEVPNWHSTERLAAGPAWVDLRPEQHRWQFTPKTLAAVLRVAGLSLTEVETFGDPMPSPGNILLSMGIPIPALRSLRSKPRVSPARPVELPIRSEDSTTAHIGRLVERPLSSMKLGKRLMAMAVAQNVEPARRAALSITAP